MKKIFTLLITPIVGFVFHDMTAMTVCGESLCMQQTTFVDVNDEVVLTAEDIQVVKDKATAVSSATRQEFEKALTAWKQAIGGNVQMRLSSSTHTYTKLPEFEVLKRMGGEIIPLIIEKLLDSENFYLLPLYEAVQIDKELVPNTMAGSEQERALQAVRMWLDAGKG